MTRQLSGSSMTSESGKAFEDIDKFIHNLKTSNAVDPIPFDQKIPSKPAPDDKDSPPNYKKVSIVGCGQVGMAIAYAILNQTIAGAISLVDMNEEKLEGEAKDLAQGSAFHQNVRIECSSQYDITADSNLVIITAGVAQKVGESRLSLVERNVGIMKSIMPQVLKYSPNTAICIVSNPCDIMTAVAAKLAGDKVPAGRIFGSGTCLDSSRLRSLLGKTLGIGAQSVHGYVIGEHGDSSVPVWSSVRVGGVPMLKDPNGPPDEIHNAMHREVVESAGDVIKKKGYTNWAVGLANAYIANAVLDDTRSVMPLSTCVRGLKGIEEDVFLSMPCSVGAHGVRRVVDLPLTDYETKAFLKSRDAVWNVQKDIWDSVA